jgi:hypothetical protein
LHAISPQIEVAILQPYVFVNIIRSVINGERRGIRTAKNFDLTVTDFDLASWQRIVHCALGTGPNNTGNLHHIFRPHIDVVVDHTLKKSAVIAQIDECEMLTMFSTSTDPTAY